MEDEKNVLAYGFEKYRYDCIRYSSDGPTDEYTLSFKNSEKYYVVMGNPSFDGVTFLKSSTDTSLRGEIPFYYRGGFPTDFKWLQFYVTEKDGTLLSVLTNDAPPGPIFGGGAKYVETCQLKK